VLVDVKFKADLRRHVSLNEIREIPECADMRLIQRGNRLSINPVTKAEFLAIKKAGMRKA
jgi:predicted RNA-binding protein with PUA-like domain